MDYKIKVVDFEFYSLLLPELESIEIKILIYIIHKVPNKLISERVNLSIRGVENRISKMFIKLSLSNRAGIDLLINDRKENHKTLQFDLFLSNQKLIMNDINEMK